MHAFTYSGHPTCAAVALKNIELLERVDAAGNAARWPALMDGCTASEEFPITATCAAGLDLRHRTGGGPRDAPARRFGQRRARGAASAASSHGLSAHHRLCAPLIIHPPTRSTVGQDGGRGHRRGASEAGLAGASALAVTHDRAIGSSRSPGFVIVSNAVFSPQRERV